MSGKSRMKGSTVASQAVDAASYLFTSWITPGQLSPKYSYWDIQIDLATSSTISIHKSATASGTILATMTFLASAVFPAGQVQGLTFMAEGSMFYNLQPAATTTFRECIINERFDW